MGTSFDDRKKGFEAKYRHDQEITFKVTARRNRLLGLWAAAQMKVDGAAADAYAKEVVAADFDRPGDSDVVHKVLTDFAEKGVAIDERHLRREMDRLGALAREQILAEAGRGEPQDTP